MYSQYREQDLTQFRELDGSRLYIHIGFGLERFHCIGFTANIHRYVGL